MAEDIYAVGAISARAGGASGAGRWSRMRRWIVANPLGAASIVVLSVITFAAVFPSIAPYGPFAVDPFHTLDSPSASHPFGTDQSGRDMLSRIIYALGPALEIAAGSVAIGVGVGTLVGLLSGYLRGWVDLLIQRVTDAFLTIPPLLSALAVATALGPSTTHAMLAVSVPFIPLTVRIVRSAVLSERERNYVESARVIGCPGWYIMFRHVLPNVTAPILIIASALFGGAILTEAALSFLGVGTQPPNPSLGAMLSLEGRFYFEKQPWLGVFPGLAISVIVVSFNFLGDAIRDSMDPHLRNR